jgi:hypothetical protein
MHLSRKVVLAVVVAGTLDLVGCQKNAAPPQHFRPRDVILITIDTLRADRVGVCGGPAGLTPALDALGRGGAVFLDATAHAPLTLPSHASILTGRYPPSHGVHDNAGFTLSDRVPTLASVLHDAGYHTAAFVASFVLRGSTGLARGFDLYDRTRRTMRRGRLPRNFLAVRTTPKWRRAISPSRRYSPRSIPTGARKRSSLPPAITVRVWESTASSSTASCCTTRPCTCRS